MENVTDAVSNPFGMRPPCPEPCAGDHRAVLGYGDANADFHVIGDHPGAHGGTETGIPFTGTAAGDRLLDALEAVGLVTGRDPLAVETTFLSYYHCCCPGAGAEPTAAAYDEYERFFDAELRGIAADVLLPVGALATAHVLREYTAKAHRTEVDMPALHGRQIRGRGFLVMPIREPADWTDDDHDTLVASLAGLRATDYHQMVDLGRFLPGGDSYLVR